MWSVTQAFMVRWLQWLASLGTSSPAHGPLYALYVGLYQSTSPPVTWTSIMSSVIEASYDGYARQEVVWYPVYQSSGGPVVLEGGSLFFSPTDSAVSQTITGIFLADAPTGGTLLAGLPLAAPGKVLATPLDAMKVLPNFMLGQGPVYGGAYIET